MIYTFTRRFSMGHRLRDVGIPLCANIHGHNWHLEWSLDFSRYPTIKLIDNIMSMGSINNISPEHQFDPKTGMIHSFAKLKGRVHSWIDNHVDHSFAFAVNDPLLEWLMENEPTTRALTCPTPPTTEVLAMLFYLKLTAFTIKEGIDAEVEINLIETPTNTVKLTQPYKLMALEHLNKGWPSRADMSINDLSLLQDDKMQLFTSFKPQQQDAEPSPETAKG